MANIIISLMLFLFCIATIFSQDTGNSITVTLLFLILMIQNIYYLNFRGGRNFSCYKVYFIFSFIFMAFIPYLHFTVGKVFWGAPEPTINNYIVTILALLVFNFIFGFTYNYRLSLNETRTFHFNSSKAEVIDNRFIFYIVLTLSVVVCYHVGNNLGNPNQLFLRVDTGEDGIVWDQGTQPILLIIGRFTMFFPLFALLFVSMYSNSKILKLFVFCCLLICAFPLVISRYAVAGIYLPIIFFFFPRLLLGLKMQYIMIFSICTIFPFLDQFRKYDPEANLSILPSVDFFFYPHFDAFQNLLTSLSFGFITYGYQLLGSIFFFIPRSIWPNKPIGSGAQLADNLDFFFNNISMPLISEAYINFGVLGIFLVPIALGILIRRLDVKFWNVGDTDTDFSIVYLYLLGYFTFILRGDLLSSWAYFCAGLFSYLLIRFYMKVSFSYPSRNL